MLGPGLFAAEGVTISVIVASMRAARRRSEESANRARRESERSERSGESLRLLLEGAKEYAILMLTPDGRVESNGNFHGAPIAYVLDFLAIPLADVASMSERRTDRFLDKARNNGLPPFLADDPGVDSGHMIAQYTQAAIVSELKRLAAPASVVASATDADAA